MSWSGARVTLGCSHLELRDAGFAPAVGDLAACYVCPVRKRVGGGQVTALRQVVNVEPLTLARRPKSIDPIWWYWEGEGN